MWVFGSYQRLNGKGMCNSGNKYSNYNIQFRLHILPKVFLHLEKLIVLFISEDNLQNDMDYNF